VGAYACRRADGRAEIVWSDDRHGLVARAIGRDADLGAIYRWWLAAAPGALD
jgi:hypothetical protein